MATTTERGVEAWIAERARADDRLYERYGRPLESEHAGQFVAIGDDGDLLLGDDEFAVATEAAHRFGRGAFALRRIGADAEARWRMQGA